MSFSLQVKTNDVKEVGIKLHIESNECNTVNFDNDLFSIFFYGENYGSRISEIIVELGTKLFYGQLSSLSNLNGPFNLVFYSKVENKLLLIRDHLGLKSLYFATKGNLFCASDSLTKLIVDCDLPTDIDWVNFEKPASVDYGNLSYGVFIKGIEELAAGTILELKYGNISFKKYWKVSYNPHTKTDKKIISDFKDLLHDAIDSRVKGKKISAYLSGGLDSTFIHKIMSINKSLHKTIILDQHLFYSSGDTQRAIEYLAMANKKADSLLVFQDFSITPAQYKLMLQKIEVPKTIWLTFFNYKSIPFLAPKYQTTLFGSGSDQLFNGEINEVSESRYWNVLYNKYLERQRFTTASNAQQFIRFPQNLGLKRHEIFINNLEMNLLFIQKHQIRPIYNLFNFNNNIPLFPFIDKRLSEFLCTINTKQHFNLLNNKNILRRAAKSLAIPAFITKKQKQDFIYYENSDPLFYTFTHLLQYNNYQLLNEVRDNAIGLNVDKIIHGIKNKSLNNVEMINIMKMMDVLVITNSLKERIAEKAKKVFKEKGIIELKGENANQNTVDKMHEAYFYKMKVYINPNVRLLAMSPDKMIVTVNNYTVLEIERYEVGICEMATKLFKIKTPQNIGSIIKRILKEKILPQIEASKLIQIFLDNGILKKSR